MPPATESPVLAGYLIPGAQLVILVAIYVQLLRFTSRIVALETTTKSHHESDRDFQDRIDREQLEQWREIRRAPHYGNGGG